MNTLQTIKAEPEDVELELVWDEEDKQIAAQAVKLIEICVFVLRRFPPKQKARLWELYKHFFVKGKPAPDLLYMLLEDWMQKEEADKEAFIKTNVA